MTLALTFDFTDQRLDLLFGHQVGSWLVDLLAPVPYKQEGNKDTRSDSCVEEQGRGEGRDGCVGPVLVIFGPCCVCAVVVHVCMYSLCRRRDGGIKGVSVGW